ncbi:MAG: SlyX family protein [Burkholderiaceae bacterium]|nr:SlyX family protein [Burkholderiaceae bacterium]
MPTDDRSEHRLTELEIKLSFTEDALDRLNEVVVRQQAQIDLLTRELLALRSQAAQAASEPGATPFRSLRDELPPHY